MDIVKDSGCQVFGGKESGMICVIIYLLDVCEVDICYYVFVKPVKYIAPRKNPNVKYIL